MKTVAYLTIGQTPRADVCDELRQLLPESVCLREYGVLDGLTAQEAKALFGYRGEGELLVSRLGTGELVELSGEAVFHGLQTCIDRAEAQGADVLLVGCTGIFPVYRHRAPLLFPGALQRKATLERAKGISIGVLAPLREQLAEIAGWWRADGAPEVMLEAADPFGDVGDMAAAALRLRQRGAGILCMDCFGYSRQARDAAEKACGLEIVLPREILAQEALRALAD